LKRERSAPYENVSVWLFSVTVRGRLYGVQLTSRVRPLVKFQPRS
jgi:hypothetical protein